MQIVFVLSHGQADVERGFSFNKAPLETNMSEMTVVSKRTIKDHMYTFNLKPYEVDCNKDLMLSVSFANSKYKFYLENEKKHKQLTAR